MLAEVEVGTAYQLTLTVEPDMAAPQLTGRAVLSTPSLMLLIEQAAMAALRSFLADDETTVGVEICISHEAPLAVGQPLTIGVELVRTNQRYFLFEAEAHGPNDTRIGGGTHTRVVLPVARLTGG